MVATAISAPALVYITPSLSRAIVLNNTFTIDKVTGKDLGTYSVMVFDGVKIKFCSIEVVADETKLPTVANVTGIKTSARGTYSVKLAEGDCIVMLGSKMRIEDLYDKKFKQKANFLQRKLKKCIM